MTCWHSDCPNHRKSLPGSALTVTWRARRGMHGSGAARRLYHDPSLACPGGLRPRRPLGLAPYSVMSGAHGRPAAEQVALARRPGPPRRPRRSDVTVTVALARWQPGPCTVRTERAQCFWLGAAVSGDNFCLESLPILLSDLVRVHQGRPAALPTATTRWDEELRARTAGVPYDSRGRGTPSHHLGRIHPYVLSCSATGTDRERSDWRT